MLSDNQSNVIDRLMQVAERDRSINTLLWRSVRARTLGECSQPLAVIHQTSEVGPDYRRVDVVE
ncbi:MAG: hypothetical protein R2708_17205 [Vicinamibacterales bacterium]